MHTHTHTHPVYSRSCIKYTQIKLDRCMQILVAFYKNSTVDLITFRRHLSDMLKYIAVRQFD